MAKDPDGFEYEETPEYLAISELLNEIAKSEEKINQDVIKEINKINGGI